MIFISHRGNIFGPSRRENHPSFVDEALGLGFDVEVDVWVFDNRIFLGHDNGEFEVGLAWFEDRRRFLWVHCKNFEALKYFSNYGGRFNYFWHDNDAATITSWGYVWVHPRAGLVRGSIAVMPKFFDDDFNSCRGVCSDFIGRVRDEFEG